MPPTVAGPQPVPTVMRPWFASARVVGYYRVILLRTKVMATNPRRTRRVTISLPEEMLEATDRQARLELRDRSELVREALRRYLTRIPAEDATPDEVAAIERGRAEHARGEYVTIEELMHDLARYRRPKRAQGAR
jgi:predicted transcriptional regulator